MKRFSLFSTPRLLVAAFVFGLLTALSPSISRADAPIRAPILYVVQYGDTLESIATRFGISAQAIAEANDLGSHGMYVGRSMYLPGGYTPVSSSAVLQYIVRRGDTLWGIARQHGVSLYALMQINRLYNPNFIFAGMRLLIPRAIYSPPQYQIYIVRLGDTLSSIAARLGTTVYALMIANNIPNPNLIFAGMRLILPSGTQPPYPSPVLGYPTARPATPGPSPTPGSAMVSVSMQNMSFTPRAITIHVGTRVVWTNNETSAIPHTVTSGAVGAPSGMFDSGTLNPGQNFQFTFNSTETFNYYCRIHGAAMTGTIIVIP